MNTKEITPLHVAFDTGTLLTLLLSREDIPGDTDIGLLGLVVDMTRMGLIRPIITDMVLAEFLGSSVPIVPENLFVLNAESKADRPIYDQSLMTQTNLQGQPQIYPKRQERLNFLVDIYNAGATFPATKTGKEYMEALLVNDTISDGFNEVVDGTRPNWRTLSEEDAKEFLLKNSREQQELLQLIKKTGLRGDRGEISIADAMQDLRKEHDSDLPMMIVYEGNDVRGHIIKRCNKPDAGYQTSHVDIEFNPHRKGFKRDNLEALGEGAFVTTLGFVAGLMRIAKSAGGFLVRPQEADIEWSERNPDKSHSPNSIRGTYETMMLTIVSHALGGRPRVYDAWKDVKFSDVTPETKHEHSVVTGKSSPWMDFTDRLPPDVKTSITLGEMERHIEMRTNQIKPISSILSALRKAKIDCSRAASERAL